MPGVRCALASGALLFCTVPVEAQTADGVAAEAPTAGVGSTPAPAAAAADASTPGLRFDVMEYVVRGNSVLAAAEIQTALMPFAGYGKTVPDVEAARTALEKTYREKGFVTVVVDVPQQDVSGGIIALTVTEGRIGQVRVEGATYVLPSEVRRVMPGLQKGVVPNVPAMQVELTAANTRATRSIVPEFRAGAAPGTVDIDLNIDDKRPWGASIELSDQYNRSTERLRVNATVHYDNLWQRGHSISVAYQTAPQDLDQIQVISGSYFAPLGYSRTSLLAYAVNSNTDVATIGGLTVLGDGLTIGARLMRTLGGSPPGVVQSLLFGFDYKDYLDQIGLVDPETGETLTFDTPVRYLPFTAQYRWIGGKAASNGEFSLGATFALDGVVGRQREFGGSVGNPLIPGSTGTPGKRADSQASFIFLFASANYNRQLGNRFDLKASVDVQLAPDPLISNEQFVLGGAANIRGYREAEALGDSGGRASLELGYKVPVAWTGAPDHIGWRVAAFLEGGYAWNQRPQPEEKHKFTLASTGLTTRFDVYDRLYGQFDLAYQFYGDPTASGQKIPDDLGGMRALFKIGLKY